MQVDAQLKRGVLEACVLAAALRQDSYGYQIIKDLEPVMQISESTLYPILKRLEASGCLTVYSQEHNGRLRKYYRTTPAGRERIQAFQEEWHTILQVYHYIEEEMQRDKG